MADDASAGTINISLQLNLAPLEKGVQDANKQLSSISSIVQKQFDAAGGALGNFGERIGNIGKNIKKMFGDDAPLVMQQFGKEMEQALGLTDSQVKGLGQTVEALEGSFKLAGQAVSFLLSPLGAVLAAAIGVVAAIGAVKNAMGGADWTKFKQEGKRLFYRATGNQLGLEEVTNEQNPGWNVLSAEMNKTFDKGAPAEKGVLGDVSIVGAFTNSLKSGMGELSPLFDGLKKALEGFLTPGVKAGAKKSTVKDEWIGYDKAWKDEAEMEKERNKARLDAINAQMEEDADFFAHDREMSERDNAQHEQYWADRKTYNDLADKAIADAQQMLQEQAQKIQERWSALGSGQFGTALGVGGVAGAGMNILGSAAVGQSRNLGTVLQGAAEGGSEGGVWGAIIGAVMALLTKTQTFKKIIDKIDVWLDDVIKALEPMLAPVADLCDVLDSFIGPLTDLISGIVKFANAIDFGMRAVTTTLKILDELGLDKLISWIGKAIGSIGESIDGLLDKLSITDDEGNTQLGPTINHRGEKPKSAEDMPDTSWGKGKDNPNTTLGAIVSGQARDEFKTAELKDFNDAFTQASFAMNSLKDTEVQMAHYAALAAETLNQFTQSTLDADQSLVLLSTAQGEQAYIENAVAQAKLQARQKELDEMVNEELVSLGLATDDATEALATFSDALVNAAPGYKLAAAGYSASEPGVSTTYSDKIEVNVTLDGQAIAESIERRQVRNSMVGGATYIRSAGTLGR